MNNYKYYISNSILYRKSLEGKLEAFTMLHGWEDAYTLNHLIEVDLMDYLFTCGNPTCEYDQAILRYFQPMIKQSIFNDLLSD